MTKNRYIGSRDRLTALRARQQAFLRILVNCAGCRERAIEASGLPKGTVLRWQGSDPWFREQYDEVREMLARDAQCLRDNLEEASTKLALGKYTGLLRGAMLRRVLDTLDEVTQGRTVDDPNLVRARRRAGREQSQPRALPSLAEIDAQILALLGE